MRKSNKVSILNVAILLTSLLFFPTCNKEESDGTLNGTWVDREDGHPQGYYVYELKFNRDSTFTSKITAFGIYMGQNKDDLTSWYENYGEYSLSGNKLILASHKLVVNGK